METMYIGGSGVPPTTSDKPGAMPGGFSKEAVSKLRAGDRANRRLTPRAGRRGKAR